MAWQQVIGQDRVKRMLQRSIIGERIPQSLLFSGEDGAGTLALSLAFARVVNCENPVVTDDAIDACGTCRSCVQAAQLQHPNITLVASLPSGAKIETTSDLNPAQLEEWKGLIATAAEDPYAEFRMHGATLIRIPQIRDLKRSLSLSNSQEGRRVVIIHHADEMNVEAANAFLKTLEEPHDNVTLILTTERPERLLQTIVSRCQEVIVSPLDDKEIIDALVSEGRCDRDEAALVAPFAEGSLTRARDFLGEDVGSEREQAVALLRAALKGRDFRVDLADLAAQAAEGRDRRRAAMLLSLLALWLRDARSISVMGGVAPIANIDQQEALERFASGFGAADFDKALTILEEAVRDIYRNVTIVTVILTCMLSLRRVFAQARAASEASS